MLPKPERKGYVLTEWGEGMYSEWQDIGGCSCHLGGAPCQSCTHEGHPISLEENDEAWKIEIIWPAFIAYEEAKKMSRDQIVNKSTTKDSPKFKFGDRVKIKVTSEFYQGSLNNPKEVVGSVVEKRSFTPEFKVTVDWDNGGTESYREYDLELVEPKLDKQEEKVDTIKVSGFCSGSPLKDVCDKWVEKQSFSPHVTPEMIRRLKTVQLEGEIVCKDVQLTIKQQEEINMTNRKIVNVTLIDNDPALDVQHSVAAQFDNLVTEDTNDVLIQEILMNPDFDVAGKIIDHNARRGDEVDLAILKSTGNQVYLQPVKLKQLTWLVK